MSSNEYATRPDVVLWSHAETAGRRERHGSRASHRPATPDEAEEDLK